MKKLLLLLLASLWLCAFPPPAKATVSCSVPFNLTNGTIADATQVMADFNSILTCLSVSTAESGANSSITSLNGLSTPITPAQGGTGSNNSAGTTGQCLVSNGTTFVPTSGCMVLLATLTASNSATLQDTTHFTAAYNEYVITIENLIPVTFDTTLELRYHTGGAFPTTGYVATVFCGGAAASFASHTSFIGVGADVEIQNVDPGLSGRLILYTPASTTVHKMVNGVTSHLVADAPTVMLACTMAGVYTATTAAVDGIEFLMNSGNIASGVVKIYGVL